MAYADYLGLMYKSQDDLRTLCIHLEEAAKKVDLPINESKTEYMVMGKRDSTRMYPTLRVDAYGDKISNSNLNSKNESKALQNKINSAIKNVFSTNEKIAFHVCTDRFVKSMLNLKEDVLSAGMGVVCGEVDDYVCIRYGSIVKVKNRGEKIPFRIFMLGEDSFYVSHLSVVQSFCL
ncbi:Hypothetical protein CINCED_3A014542 [Cinara cedri]|uniref:Reverse transcriptase domain n=1 Tax=Cinara cedri TaxID=506608 RepID=A0A5E4LZ27_9HEMI|nr:Hypothetical protein CINCED_3A014542 [Cinara cedri]